jgi:flagellar hook-associated protein 2
MVQPAFRIGGIASGLDTESIISSLVSLERIPINRMAVQRQAAQARTDAWTDINTKVSQFRSTVDDLRYGGGLDAPAATSSHPDSVVASVTGSAVPGTVSFTVDQLATNHNVITTSAFTAGTDTVGAGSFTVTIGTTDHVVTTDATTTLDELAAQIRALDVGIQATVLKVGDSDHRLSLVAESTGAAGEFTTSTDLTALGSNQVVSQGVDALVTLGSGAGAVQVSRSSNVVSDLIQGVQLIGASAQTVTITTERDVEAVADNIIAMFDAANGVLGEIDRLTAYDETTRRGSALTGDSMARTLDSRLNDALSSIIGDLGTGLTSGAPVSYNRTGEVEVDRDRLVAALRDEYSTISSLLTGTFTATDSRLTPLSTSSATVPGTYSVVVSGVGSSPTVVGSAYAASGSDETFDLQYGTTDVNITVTAGSDITSAVDQINTALTAAGVTAVVASDNGGAIQLTTPDLVGADLSFVVTNDALWGLTGTHTGTDAAGTIDGETATTSNNRFSATSGSPNGLTVDIDLSAVDTSGGAVTVGSITFTDGVLLDLDRLLDEVEGVDGLIARARDEHDTRISDISDQIAAMELRIEQRESTIRRQYTAMEQALNELQSGASFLSGLLPPSGGS